MFGRPLKDKDFSEIDRMVLEGKIPDESGKTWDFGTKDRPFPGANLKAVPKESKFRLRHTNNAKMNKLVDFKERTKDRPSTWSHEKLITDIDLKRDIIFKGILS